MTAKKVFFSTLFVTMLVVPTVLGAIPLAVHTPVGIVSTEVQEAEAANRNTTANRPRSASVRNAGARLHQNFSATRTSYRVEVRQSTDHANIRVGIASGQQHRWRIDTRNASGNWVNGSYNTWRARATSNINRDVRVNVNQGQERRLRLQIRDRNNNVRTITFNVQRAGGNTWGANLRSNAGTFNQAFDRAVTSYTLTIPHGRTATTQVGMRSSQERAMARHRVRIQNADGTWRAWSAWSSYGRGQQTRNVGTIPQGRSAEVQFMIRGAWTNRDNTPLRTRTYTVRVNRPNPPISNWDFNSTTSAIQLPNRQLTAQERTNWIAEYNQMGGASAFELEVVRLINVERNRHGLNSLAIDTRLMHASRFYAQTLSQLVVNSLGHHYGPYGGSFGTATAFGVNAFTGNAAAGQRTPEALVTAWMNSPGHRANILRANSTHVGVGSQAGGQWGVFHYSLSR